MEKTADVVVIGGGILGASTAHFLCKKRIGKVVLLEQRALASVSTGHSAASVRTCYSNPESTEGGRLVSILKWPEGAPLNLG